MNGNQVTHSTTERGDAVIVRSELRLVTCCNFNRLRAGDKTNKESAKDHNIKAIGDLIYGDLIGEVMNCRSRVLEHAFDWSDIVAINDAFSDLVNKLDKARTMK